MRRLFGADGIRGVIDRHPLRREDAERLGRAVGAWLRQGVPVPSFLVGTDTRESSQRLKVALTDGLTRAGVQVVDGGVLPTAAISYLIASKGLFAGGAVVSASHNPIIENGIKLFDQRGVKFDDPTEALIEELFFGNTPLPFEIRPAPSTSEPDYARQYAHALAREYRDYEWHRCHAVVDCANGAAYQVGPLLLENLGLPYTLLNAFPDGTNINRLAGSEYVRLNPQRLAAELHGYDAEIGVTLDGDADRVLLVDHEGRLYDGDMMLAMLALKLHHEQRLQQDTVVTTPMSNSGLQDYLRKRRMRVRVVRNGDKYITDALLEHDLTLGGEEIGHIIIHTDHSHVTGDGLRTALSILGELTRSPGITLQDLALGMRKWPQVKVSVPVGRRVYVPPDDIPGLIALIQQTQTAIPDLTRLECRPASTEPVYRIMLEARVTPIPILAKQAHHLAEHIQRHFGCLGRPVDILDCVNGGRITPSPPDPSL
ncbi:MAG TPA: phosphoglucosamine mutase [Chloroflexi bacterium]|nr:phosphoglucosamine mutase [Chloroflexota bacterium]